MSEQQLRLDVLRGLDLDEEVVRELLAYNAPGCDAGSLRHLTFPLPDEPHLGAWDEYAQMAEHKGVLETLRERLVQLEFPIQEGISQTEGYRAATRRGHPPPSGAPGLGLVQPEALTLTMHATPAGRIPILFTPERPDFETLVRALSARNEPEPVPPSMGAMIIGGLNNWDRVRTYRRKWEGERRTAGDEEAWTEEFRRLVPQKTLYQDRFLVLSSGPYSAVSAQDVGLDQEEWLSRSLVLRREHECTHYLTRRALGFMRNNAFDEILADFCGLWAAFGRYDPDFALLFLGLEHFPAFRPGGRLRSYLGSPRLSAPAEEGLRALVVTAVRNLARLDPPADGRGVTGWLPALATLTLEQLASSDLVGLVAARDAAVLR